MTKRNRLFGLVAALGYLFSVLGRTDIFGRPHREWIVWSGLAIGTVGSFLSIPKGYWLRPNKLLAFVAAILLVMLGGVFIVLYMQH